MFKNTIYTVILVIAAALFAWIVPFLVQTATEEAQGYPFCYYSSKIHQFCTIEHTQHNQVERYDQTGKRYTKAEFDTILPMFYARQLFADGTMPDSMYGKKITQKILDKESIFFRMQPAKKNQPTQGLYPMYESQSNRVQIESTLDMFRIQNSVEFIDMESNTINIEKSKLFTQALHKAQFQFPAQWISGNPTTKKMYDEGYFVLDSNNKLYHIKMVKGEPFVKDTHIQDRVSVEYFSMIEVANKKMYGLLYSKDHHIYRVQLPNYQLTQMPIEYDVNNDNLIVIGNLFFWNVSITNSHGKYMYALHSDNLTLADKLENKLPKDLWEKLSEVLFPIQIDFMSPNSKYIYPRYALGGAIAWIVSIVLAIGAFAFDKSQKKSLKWPAYILIALMGIPGLLAWIATPRVD